MALTKKGYLPRVADEILEKKLEQYGAVCVEGPKWCGKTWLALNHSNSAIMIGDPKNNFQNKTLVEVDIGSAFVGEEPHLIDEWQEVPSIWDATRYKVDEKGTVGRFILTGSSTPKRKGVLHSGAGRIGTVSMRTMSLYESGDSNGAVSLRELFYGNVSPSYAPELGLEDIVGLTVRGGWPQTIGMEANGASSVVRDYLDRTIDDAIHIDGKNRSRDKMRMLVRSLARNEGTLASDAKIAKDIYGEYDLNLARTTVAEYLDVLGRLFVTRDQSAFSPNLRSSVRVGKTAKRHLVDPALSVAALNLSTEKLMNDLNTYGFMFEAMCERDLQIYAYSFGGELFHYRDGNGREIDAIVEAPDGRWGAFEVKLGANQIDEAAKNLLDAKRFFEADGRGRGPSVLCVICGTATASYRRDDGVFVVPITALRN